MDDQLDGTEETMEDWLEYLKPVDVPDLNNNVGDQVLVEEYMPTTRDLLVGGGASTGNALPSYTLSELAQLRGDRESQDIDGKGEKGEEQENECEGLGEEEKKSLLKRSISLPNRKTIEGQPSTPPPPSETGPSTTSLAPLAVANSAPSVAPQIDLDPSKVESDLKKSEDVGTVTPNIHLPSLFKNEAGNNKSNMGKSLSSHLAVTPHFETSLSKMRSSIVYVSSPA